MPADASAARCPVCGRPNRCALADGAASATACWCADVRIAPEALRRIPAGLRGRACLCPDCAAAQRSSPADSRNRAATRR
jgi:hypothetical protein